MTDARWSTLLQPPLSKRENGKGEPTQRRH